LIYLRAVQQHSAKARSQLGALYATGHCVPQDRVEAYRWFTSALALDPHNVWLDRQRNILLAQMTSQERQRAR
jgi:TPR repeat protein